MTAPEPRRPTASGPADPGPADPGVAGPGVAGPGTAGSTGDSGDGAAAAGAEGAAGLEGERRSGLSNPEAAVRGLGAGTLVMEALVLLLAIQPVRLLAGDRRGWGVGVAVALAAFAVLLAGMMRRRWAWHAGTVLQVLLLLSGLLHWSLGALGLIFGAAWAYAGHVRRTILG